MQGYTACNTTDNLKHPVEDPPMEDCGVFLQDRREEVFEIATVRMVQYKVQITLTEGLGFLGIAECLKVDKQGDERGYGGLCEGIAGGDVHLLGFVGQTMDDRLQQAFVGQDNGCLLAVGDARSVEPGADITGLNILCRGRDKGHLLLVVEVPVDVCGGIVELVGEALKVL